MDSPLRLAKIPFHLCFKNDEEKSNASQVHRELQSLRETCMELEKRNEKLAHDLAAKESQNSGLQVRHILP
jgi:hypothetical protein